MRFANWHQLTLLAATCWFSTPMESTKAENRLGEEFSMECPSALVRDASSPSAEDLTTNIFNSAANFCDDVSFHDDVTIVVV